MNESETASACCDASAKEDLIICFEDVKLGYGHHVILESLSFCMKRGDFLGVIGPNGSGKTTLLRAILGLLRPLSGNVKTAEDLRYGYVMQRQFLDTLFPFTVDAIVRMGRLGQKRPWQRTNREDERAVDEAIQVTGLTDRRDQLYRELSGGWRQRALIARALASRPDVLLLDEPTNDMDVNAENRIMSLVQKIQKDFDVTIVLVSHLLQVVLNYTDGLIFLADRKAHVHSIDEILSCDLLSGIYDYPVKVGVDSGKKYLISG